jgi:hypothetical protein
MKARGTYITAQSATRYLLQCGIPADALAALSPTTIDGAQSGLPVYDIINVRSLCLRFVAPKVLPAIGDFLSVTQKQRLQRRLKMSKL